MTSCSVAKLAGSIFLSCLRASNMCHESQLWLDDGNETTCVFASFAKPSQSPVSFPDGQETEAEHGWESSARLVLVFLMWVWLKIKQEGLRRFWSMFPLNRVPFWCRFFEPQPCAAHFKGGSGRSLASGGCCEDCCGHRRHAERPADARAWIHANCRAHGCGVGAPILVYFSWDCGCSLGVRAFDPWPHVKICQHLSKRCWFLCVGFCLPTNEFAERGLCVAMCQNQKLEGNGWFRVGFCCDLPRKGPLFWFRVKTNLICL